MSQPESYARVILPLRLRGGQVYTYRVPECFRGQVDRGSVVTVQVVTARYRGVVCELLASPDIDAFRIRPILSVESDRKIRETELSFWKQLSDYYMCTIGEVYAAACPSSTKPLRRKPSSGDDGKTEGTDPARVADIGEIHPLSEAQRRACDSIEEAFSNHKTVLLNGVTGSGKTEIYISLIKKTLEAGRSVLYMLPEKAVSRQLTGRLKKVFGGRVAVFHSGVPPAARREIILTLAADGRSPRLVVGLRSAVFLPFGNLGLVIVDEEHDSSYKQYEPAPRYNGRDAALMLARIHGADVLLGSATPSFESLYNVRAGRYAGVLLEVKFNEAPEPFVTIVDMKKKRRERAVAGSISFVLRDAIRLRLEKAEQVLVFRSRRAYAPAVQCELCGEIPRCPHCHTALTWHKFSGSLNCHWCGYAYRLSPGMNCPCCGDGTIAPLGAGTERIEEELRDMFPDARVARYDIDTSGEQGGREVLKAYSEGSIDILVGTQMISKGFDFPNLTLAAVIQGESLIGINDFRADEKALQLLTQLRGRVGRRRKQGEIIIQTALPSHPVFRLDDISALMDERRKFGFPPFVRMVEITVRNRSRVRLNEESALVKSVLQGCGVKDFDGPVSGPVEKLRDEYLDRFTLRLPRSRASGELKRLLAERLSLLESDITVNVDPL